jgi:hypothetical protein
MKPSRRQQQQKILKVGMNALVGWIQRRSWGNEGVFKFLLLLLL